MKNKTAALWLTLIVGPLGLNRIYTRGRFDVWSWVTLVPTLLGIYGVIRAREWGMDDQLSWLLMPLGGFAIASCALLALIYGVMDAATWNQRFNPSASLTPDHAAGESGWLTVFGLIASLMIGATVLIASIVFTFQRIFELAV